MTDPRIEFDVQSTGTLPGISADHSVERLTVTYRRLGLRLRATGSAPEAAREASEVAARSDDSGLMAPAALERDDDEERSVLRARVARMSL